MRVYPLPSPLCGTGAGWDLSPAWRLRSVARPLLHEGEEGKGHLAGGGPVLEEQVGHLHRAFVGFEDVRPDLRPQACARL